jgi:hypothetical protein
MKSISLDITVCRMAVLVQLERLFNNLTTIYLLRHYDQFASKYDTSAFWILKSCSKLRHLIFQHDFRFSGAMDWHVLKDIPDLESISFPAVLLDVEQAEIIHTSAPNLKTVAFFHQAAAESKYYRQIGREFRNVEKIVYVGTGRDLLLLCNALLNPFTFPRLTTLEIDIRPVIMNGTVQEIVNRALTLVSKVRKNAIEVVVFDLSVVLPGDFCHSCGQNSSGLWFHSHCQC